MLSLLNLAHNNLNSLPESISQLKALRILELSHNQLSSLPNSFTLLESLWELHIEHNQLTQLPSNLIRLKDLRHLHAHHNQLSHLTPTFAETSLVQIDVSNNPWSTAPVVPIYHFQTLKEIVARFLLNNQFKHSMLPNDLINWMKTAKTCDECKGAYFEVFAFSMIPSAVGSEPNVPIAYKVCSYRCARVLRQKHMQ